MNELLGGGDEQSAGRLQQLCVGLCPDSRGRARCSPVILSSGGGHVIGRQMNFSLEFNTKHFMLVLNTLLHIFINPSSPEGNT